MPCLRMLWSGSSSVCGLWSLSLLVAHCFSASALWACFCFERPCPASPLLCWLQLSFFSRNVILTHFIFLTFDLPWMEHNTIRIQFECNHAKMSSQVQEKWKLWHWVKESRAIFNCKILKIWFHASWSVQDAVMCDGKSLLYWQDCMPAFCQWFIWV